MARNTVEIAYSNRMHFGIFHMVLFQISTNELKIATCIVIAMAMQVAIFSWF